MGHAHSTRRYFGQIGNTKTLEHDSSLKNLSTYPLIHLINKRLRISPHLVFRFCELKLPHGYIRYERTSPGLEGIRSGYRRRTSRPCPRLETTRHGNSSRRRPEGRQLCA